MLLDLFVQEILKNTYFQGKQKIIVAAFVKIKFKKYIIPTSISMSEPKLLYLLFD